MTQFRHLISSVALIGSLSALGMPQGAIASSAVKIDTVQRPSGTVYRGGSENPCQQKQNHVDICLHINRLGGCDRTMDDLKQFSPPDDIGGPHRSQGSGTRNKPH